MLKNNIYFHIQSMIVQLLWLIAGKVDRETHGHERRLDLWTWLFFYCFLNILRHLLPSWTTLRGFWWWIMIFNTADAFISSTLKLKTSINFFRNLNSIFSLSISGFVASLPVFRTEQVGNAKRISSWLNFNAPHWVRHNGTRKVGQMWFLKALYCTLILLLSASFLT